MELSRWTIRLAACFFAAVGNSCQIPKGTVADDQDAARQLPEVGLEAPEYAPLECTPEAREAGLKGTLTIRIVVRRDGTVDPDHWEILKGDKGPLADRWMEHIAAAWKFTPLEVRGEPRDSELVLEVDYDCTKKP